MSNDSIDPRRLAQTAYRAKIVRIEELQKQLLLNELLVSHFGSRAIAVGVMKTTQTLADAEARMTRSLARDREELRLLYKEVTYLEDLFKQANDADMDAMAAHLREKYRSGK